MSDGNLSEPALRSLLAEAVERRGDVTLSLTDGSELVGYVFAVDWDASPAVVRLLPADGGPRRSVAWSEVARIELTGRDATAAPAFQRSRDVAARGREGR